MHREPRDLPGDVPECDVTNLEATTPTGRDRKLRDVQLAALRSQADDLRAELNEYDELRSGHIATIEAGSLADLAGALIKARIARGWTQHDLADKLGIAEQQIQRYEATNYTSASLARLCDIADALHITSRETLDLGANDPA